MKEEPRRKYNVLSLFTGAGGLDLGFEQTGRFETLAAVEYQPEFAETLRLNQRNGYFPKMRVYQADIRELDPHQVAQECFPDGRVDVIIGGPPCETFSQLGKRAGIADPRGLLASAYFSWVTTLSPEAFLMENVPQLATGPSQGYFDSLIGSACHCGYVVRHSVLCAAAYGAATRRWRLICMGALRGQPRFPPPETHGERSLISDLLPWRTVRDALQGLPTARSHPAFEGDDHVACRHDDVVVSRFLLLAPGERDHKRRRNRLRWDEPAYTIFAGTIRSIARHIHPEEPRELTNRECARIHGFPDNFRFAGRPPAVCKQIANSVPIEFARALGFSVAETLDALHSHEDRREPLSAEGPIIG